MDFTKYKLTRTNILLKRREAESQTKGGIFLPEAAKNRPLEATVVLVGDEVNSVVPGDDVIFDRFAGAEMPLEDKTFLIMDEADILIIIKK
jgi:chaperonin GroES